MRAPSRRKAGGCRLSSPAHDIMPADSVRARGRPRQTRRPQERAGTARGTERVISPAHHIGALRGGAPFEGVARDAKRLALRGRLSPSNLLSENLLQISVNSNCIWRIREQIVTKPLIKVDLVIGFVTLSLTASARGKATSSKSFDRKHVTYFGYSRVSPRFDAIIEAIAALEHDLNASQ